MSTANSIFNKVFICLFCSGPACGFSACQTCWTFLEALGLSYLNEQACCWALCAPICHECELGDTNEAITKCGMSIRYCLLSQAVFWLCPFDSCYTCISYNMDNCSTGVSGFKDISKHSMWLGKKIREVLELKADNEPEKTFRDFKP